MRVITIGSCLSRFTAVWLGRDYGIPAPLNQVMHVTSEQLCIYYIDEAEPIPPSEIFDRYICHNPKYEEFVRLMIRNIQPKHIGLAEYTDDDLAKRANLIDTLNNQEIDLIICDNLFELTAAPYYLINEEEFLNSPMNIPIWLCDNYRDLNKNLRPSDGPLNAAAAAGHWVRVLDWMRKLQPSARIVFLCCPGSTSVEVAPDRANRAIAFYPALIEAIGERNIEVMPPWNIDKKFEKDNDWTHFHDYFYRSLAGYLFMTSNFGFFHSPNPALR